MEDRRRNSRQLRPREHRTRRSRDSRVVTESTRHYSNRMPHRRVNHPLVHQPPVYQPQVNQPPVNQPVVMTTRIATLPYPPLYQRIKGEGEGSSSSDGYGQASTSSTVMISDHRGGAVPIDLPSQQGKFGWVRVGVEDLPVIKRGEQKFCSVRMIETNILTKHYNFLNPEIFSCTCIRSYFVTHKEAELLTSINSDHCENKFGEGDFNMSDLIVKVEDVRKFCDFLNFCYEKLLCPSPSMNPHCGFLHINRESVIAYTIKDDIRYVPLFYFDGVNSQLRNKAEVLEGWEVAYLKFCCKIQGIRKEFLDNNICSVVRWDDLKYYFPPNTLFENYWPPKQSGNPMTTFNY